jgi:hypothetical protein
MTSLSNREHKYVRATHRFVRDTNNRSQISFILTIIGFILSVISFIIYIVMSLFYKERMPDSFELNLVFRYKRNQRFQKLQEEHLEAITKAAAKLHRD